VIREFEVLGEAAGQISSKHVINFLTFHGKNLLDLEIGLSTHIST